MEGISVSSIQGDKHEAILDAGYALFGSNGFYETKMSDIADRACIAKGTVYLYFKSKEDLFMAVTRRDCENFLDQLRCELDQRSGIDDKLVCAADHHLRYYYRCRKHTKLFFMAPNNNPELNTYLKQFMENYMRIVVQVLETEHADDALLYAQVYIGMLDRLKMDIMYNPDFCEQDLEMRGRFASNLFINGFRSTGSINNIAGAFSDAAYNPPNRPG